LPEHVYEAAETIILIKNKIQFKAPTKATTQWPTEFHTKPQGFD